MSQKVLIGAVVLAGGAYLYDKNVSPIFSKQKVQVNYELQKLEHKSKDLGDKLTDKLQDTKQDLSKKTSEIKKSVEKSDLYNSLKQKTTDFQKQAEQYKHDVKDAANADKSFFVKGVHYYIDKVNEIAGATEQTTEYSTMSHRVEVKPQQPSKSWWNSWFGSKEKEVKQFGENVKNDAEQTKNSWLNWGSKKADEVEKSIDHKSDVARSDYYKTKSNAEGAYQDTKKSVESTYNDIKKEAQNYGSTAYNEGKDKAINAYETAKKEYDNFASGLSSADTKHLEKAKQNLNSALNNLKSYGEEVVNEVNKKFK